MRKGSYDGKDIRELYVTNKEPFNKCKEDLQAMLDLINSIPEVDDEVIEESMDFSVFYLALLGSIAMRHSIYLKHIEQIMKNTIDL